MMGAGQEGKSQDLCLWLGSRGHVDRLALDRSVDSSSVVTKGKAERDGQVQLGGEIQECEADMYVVLSIYFPKGTGEVKCKEWSGLLEIQRETEKGYNSFGDLGESTLQINGEESGWMTYP